MSKDLSREEIYRLYQEKVSRYVHGKVSGYHDAEDLVSAVFVKVYQHLDSFDEQKASLSTWIYRITQNTVTDWYRTNRNHTELTELVPSGEDVEERVLNEEMLDALADALEKLGTRERDLVIFHYYKGYPLKEIAGMMGVSYATSKNIHKAALSALRKQLSGSA